jgi:CRISPR/Cas system-associated exonuclease Cas4 (RecB family)
LQSEALKRQNRKELSEGWFSASELGLCPRMLYFKRNGTKAEPKIPKNVFRLEDGKAVHLRIQNDLKAAGILEKSEHYVEDLENRICGHPDGVIAILDDRALLEIKTIGSTYFSSLSGSPLKSHFKQGNFYAVVEGLEHIYFLYYCADNGKTLEYAVEADHLTYVNSVKMVNKVRECLKKGVPPEETVTDFCFSCDYAYCCKPKKERQVEVL